MTNDEHITTEIEATGSAQFSSISITKLFALHNVALSDAAEAELDLSHMSGADPAVDNWISEAEAAWSAVERIQCALVASPSFLETERVLIAMAARSAAMMKTETLADFWAAFDGMRLAFFMLGSGRAGRYPREVNRLLHECQKHLSAIAALNLYQPVCNSDDLSYALSEMWAEAC